MKAFWAWLVSSLCTVGLVTGTLFYVIPKYVQNNETGYVKFIDNVGAFIAANWIWLTIIVAIAIVAVVALAVLFTKKRR